MEQLHLPQICCPFPASVPGNEIAGKVVHKNLPHYMAGRRSWIRGNLDWSLFDTERYVVKVMKRDEEYLSFSKIFLEE